MDDIIGALKEISDGENVNSNIDDASLISQVNVVLIGETNSMSLCTC